MAAVEPFPIEPPGTPDDVGWTDNISRIGTNLQNNLETIAKVPIDVVHGAQSAIHWIQGVFADPAADPPAPPEVTDAEAQAWLPSMDPFIEYTGPGAQPTWNDVNGWAQSTTHAQTPDLNTVTPTVGVQVQRAIDVSAGQVIKALSGFINQTANLDKLAATVLAQRIADTQTVIGALTNNQAGINTNTANVLHLIVTGSLPQLWAEVNKLHAQIAGTAAAILHDAQVWVNANVRTPLEENLGAEKTAREAQVKALEDGLPSIIGAEVAKLGLAAAADVASLAQRVAALETENTECTEPMCQTMGPNTNLGKLLKGLNLALDAAFIAELLAMKEGDIVALFQAIYAKVAGVVNDFETTFQPGGETIAQFVANTIGTVI